MESVGRGDDSRDGEGRATQEAKAGVRTATARPCAFHPILSVENELIVDGNLNKVVLRFVPHRQPT